MIRNILAASAFAKAHQNRYPCLLHSWEYTKYAPRWTRNIQTYKLERCVIKVFPRIFPRKNPRTIMLYSGLLTLLGLQREEADSELITAIKTGILFIKRGDFEKAERTLHVALQLAYQEQNEDGITYVYDILANLALDTGQDEKAEKLFTNVMRRLLNRGYKRNDNKILHIGLKLSKIYENTRDYENAEVGFMYCIDHLKEKVSAIEDVDEENKDTLSLWITTLDNYARFLVNQNRPTEALEYFKTAYEMSNKVNGEESEESALLLNDLGITSNMLGDPESALSYAKAAVNIVRDHPEMENLPFIYMNLGYLYLSREMHNKAMEACQMALRYARRDENEDDIKAAKECLQNIKDALRGPRDE
ncbi:UNVERIFIED_CONTAM: hypothetical protein PYX00_006284 [Menopon gallinae]|uniref:Uncharacterized protein n=1 Tax=Menopon gallinae TaxID=328185 RepID=A0AAW2HUT3_9NEOP